MKTQHPEISSASFTTYTPSEPEISDYAFLLYQQGNCEHGHDLDHWQEATAFLSAGIPHSIASI